MTFSQRIYFYTKIGIVILIITTAFLYYVASKNYSLYIFHAPKKVASENFRIHKNHSLTNRSSYFVNSLTVKNEPYKFIAEEGNITRFGNGFEKITIAVVLCGDRLNQTLITIKSALIFSKKSLHFLIILDESNREPMKKKLLEWPEKVLERISFEIHLISFPDGEEGKVWKKLFKLCACQRLFLPSLFLQIDSLIYVDTDVIFMHPVENLWLYFNKMNASQIAGLSPEHEDFSTGWYNRFARHPYYGPRGVNSGVMLMNLTRMRTFQWDKYLTPILQEYKLNIVWGDQDIINIIFHFHPDKLYIFPCAWNYRPDHCMYGSVCPSAKQNGVSIIHGNRGVFYNNKQPAFKIIYNAMQQYDFEKDLPNMFIKKFQKSLDKPLNSNCGRHLSLTFSSKSLNSTALVKR